ncbi:hypothetical protein [Microvirus mar26]|uniref:Uncharacterized protein n=2 Tax=unclassified Microviridae TaxID=117574 RepID=A0A8F5RAX5_9VIRU|nr:hypothetical protein [Microvirus mar24]QXN75116.1 hypothetical protein [Microvirus mar26]
MQYFEILCPSICFVVCLIHSVIQLVVSHKTGKKITSLCEKCGLPVLDDEVHKCSLSPEQLSKLVDFVASLKGHDNDNSK